jgi:hypothetical protein
MTTTKAMATDGWMATATGTTMMTGRAIIIMVISAPTMATVMATVTVMATARAMTTAKLMATGSARSLQNCLLTKMHECEYKNFSLIAHSCMTQKMVKKTSLITYGESLYAYGESRYAYGDWAPKICTWGLPVCKKWSLYAYGD